MDLEAKRDKAIEIINDGLDRQYARKQKDKKYKQHEIFGEQPRNCSFVVIDIDLGAYASDVWDDISYDNTKDMQNEIKLLIEDYFTFELLDLFRKGVVKNLTLRIGPHCQSYGDLNDHNGIDKFTYLEDGN